MRSKIAAAVTMLVVILTGMWAVVMLTSGTTTRMLCGGNPPALGGQFPVVSPGDGVIKHMTLSFSLTASAKGTCYRIHTPTKISAVASVLAGAPPTLTGVRCAYKSGNPLAFIHLKKQPFQKPRASTDRENPIPFIDYYGPAPLKVVWGDTGSITVTIPKPDTVCINGIKTEPLKLVSTLSALVGIPYPFFGEAPDWETLRLWLPKASYSLATIRYAELLAYRVGYFQALAGHKPVNFHSYTAVAYMYHIKGEYDSAIAEAMKSIAKLEREEQKIVATLIKSRIYSRIPNLVAFLLLVAIFLYLMGPWSILGILTGIVPVAVVWQWPLQPPYSLAVGAATAIITFIATAIMTKKGVKAAAGTATVALTPMIAVAIILTIYGLTPTLLLPSPQTIQTMTALLYTSIGASAVGFITAGANLLALRSWR
jgi:hypothetical protein